MMRSAAPRQFGPFVVLGQIRRRPRVTLHYAVLLNGSGGPEPVILRRTQPLDDGGNEALLRAASTYAVLHHHAIAEVRDFGEIDGRTYVATEAVPGRDLLHVLAECGRRSVGFPTDVALYIVRSVLEAAGHAHGLEDRSGRPLGAIHGDIVHSNVLLTPDGEVRLADFGLHMASTRRRTEDGLHIASNGDFTCYLSPEQLRRERPDSRADIFLTGVLLYELVTGHVLHRSTSSDELIDRVTRGTNEIAPERHRRDLHPLLGWIIRKALEPDPADRFQHTESFIEAIDELIRQARASIQPAFLSDLMRQLFGRAGSGIGNAI